MSKNKIVFTILFAFFLFFLILLLLNFFRNKENVIVEEGRPLVNEEISNPEMMAEGLSEDIPVLGGKIIRAYEGGGMALVVMESSSSIEEAFELYKQAFEETEWTISSTSKDEELADIIFNNGLEFLSEGYRDGRVAILVDEEIKGTNITVRENFYMY